MYKKLLYAAGTTAACRYAAKLLSERGFLFIDHPSPEITDLILDVPTFCPDGRLKNGESPEKLLSMLPRNVTVAGGNLNHPALASHKTLDLLLDPYYLASNAAITADCALRIAASHIKTTFSDTPTLILGWGRIGKCLSQLLKGTGCPVTVAARKETDRAVLQSLGYQTLDFTDIPLQLPSFRLLFNTVPAPILDMESVSLKKPCTLIELASVNGITGSETVIARALPGTYAPESSGRLIADTLCRLWKEEIK